MRLLRVRFARALGERARDRGRYAEAEVRLRAAARFAEEQLGPDHMETIATLNALGMVHKYRGQFRAGRAAYGQALRGAKSLRRVDPLILATLYHNVGGLEHARGRFRRALPFAREAVHLRISSLGPSHPDVAADKAALAAILEGLGRYAEAEACSRRIDLAAALNNLATCCASTGRLVEAQAFAERALDIKENALGRAHPDVGVTLANLAIIRWRLGRALDAEVAHAHAIAILQATLGDEHPRVEHVRTAAAAARAQAGPEESRGEPPEESSRSGRRTATGAVPRSLREELPELLESRPRVFHQGI
jgi:tetratricopeptide (TPR) repeat protein